MDLLDCGVAHFTSQNASVTCSGTQCTTYTVGGVAYFASIQVHHDSQICRLNFTVHEVSDARSMVVYPPVVTVDYYVTSVAIGRMQQLFSERRSLATRRD